MSILLTSYCQNELQSLLDSMQKEFEYMLSFSAPNVLEAKKRQIKRIEYIMELMDSVNQRYAEKDEMIQKLQACLLHYCVTPEEVDYFISKPLPECVKLAATQREPLDLIKYESFPRFVKTLAATVNRTELEEFRRVHGFNK